MRIEVIGDDSVSPQARTYAEYRVFAALSQVVDTRRVRSASLVIHRATTRRNHDLVVCSVTVEVDGGEAARVKASGDHPYAAINRAADRLREHAWPAAHDASHRDLTARAGSVLQEN